MSEEIMVEKKHKAKYRSALRSIRLIREAYVALMQEKETDKISVSDIVKKADLNRGTFYAHYNKPSDIKDEISNEIVQQVNIVLGDFNFGDFFMDPYPFLIRIENILKENLVYYKEIMCYTMSIDFLRKIKQSLLDIIQNDTGISEEAKQSPQYLVAVDFIAGGMLSIYTSYVQGKIEAPENTMSETLAAIISSGAQTFMKPL